MHRSPPEIRSGVVVAVDVCVVDVVGLVVAVVVTDVVGVVLAAQEYSDWAVPSRTLMSADANRLQVVSFPAPPTRNRAAWHKAPPFSGVHDSPV